MNDRNIDAREPFWATLRKIVTNGGARRTMITHPLRKIADEQEKQRKADQKRLPPSFIAKNRAILRAWGKQQQPEKPRPLHWKVQAAVRVGHKEKQPFENAHPVHHKRNLEDLLERDPFDLD
jgi:hypothetical protein